MPKRPRMTVYRPACRLLPRRSPLMAFRLARRRHFCLATVDIFYSGPANITQVIDTAYGTRLAH